MGADIPSLLTFTSHFPLIQLSCSIVQCLAVHIDVGTNNETLLADPTYPGLKHSRVRGAQFFGLMAEFIEACKDAYGEHVLIQVQFNALTHSE